jgi:lipid II:glycine glycyltransferase (peptidoglycan interpeptide bridge formation enzyme)
MNEIKDPKHFFEIQSKFERIPFTQSEAWYNYSQAKGESIVFFVDDEKDTQIAFWGKKKKLPLISKYILLVDTPLLKSNLTEKTIRKRFLSLVEHDYIAFEIDSIFEYDVEYEVGLRRAGFVRPLGIYKCPLSIEMDLTKTLNFDKKWKRDTKRAKEEGVFLSEVKQPGENDAITFCNLFQETKSKKELKYSLKSKEILVLLKSPGIRLFYGITQDENIASAQISYINGNFCYSIFRVNSILSRSNNAAYVLYNDLIELLSQEKRLTFDLGRIPPSNNKSDNVYHFKNASRGRKIQYNGEWVFYKNKWVEYLMFAYKQFIVKKQRY